MMRTHLLRPWMTLALAAAATLVAVPAPAFRVESNFGVTATTPVHPKSVPPVRIIHWDLREFDGCQIPYSIDNAGCRDSLAGGGFQAINNAFSTWTATMPTPIEFFRRPNPAGNLNGNNQTNLLAFDSTNANTFLGPRLSGTLALTYVWTQAGTGQIQESDIIFNDRDWQWNTTGDDFNSDTTANAAPFNIAAGDTLRLRIDNGPVRTIVFNAANITPGAATAAQVFAAIDSQVPETIFGYGTVSGGIQIVSGRCDGHGSLEITGGTGTLPAALSFQAGRVFTRRADIETVALHEIGHFFGLAHSSDNGAEPNATYSGAVMYAFAPATGTKRVLTGDDETGINFMYTPDYGDAQDPTYQSLVHTMTFKRQLNGVDLHQPDDGAGHLFHYNAVDSLRLEWLGPDFDDSVVECEARITDNDSYDDGVTIPNPMIRGINNTVKVVISYGDMARYDAANPIRVLYFNGYFDFFGDGVFDPGDREIWWRGVPGSTIAASPNWVMTNSNFLAKTITITFDVVPSLASVANAWSRFRVDLGEDEGRVNNFNGDLAPATYIAQFGEVEDYPIRMIDEPVAVLVPGFVAEASADAVTLSWGRPSGEVDEAADLYRSEAGGAEQLVARAVRPGADGARFVDANVEPGATYTYRLGLFRGEEAIAGPSLVVRVPAAELALAGVMPNPVSRSGAVRFSLPRAGHARLSLYSVTGQRVRVVADGEFRAGEQTVPWDGQDQAGSRVAAGIYFLRLEAAGGTRIARAVVVN